MFDGLLIIGTINKPVWKKVNSLVVTKRVVFMVVI